MVFRFRERIDTRTGSVARVAGSIAGGRKPAAPKSASPSANARMSWRRRQDDYRKPSTADMRRSSYVYYHWYMSMKRTNVYADPEDLAIIKEAAARRGISESEIIRQGIHLAAMANRVWDEPLFSRTFEGSGRTPTKEDVRNAVADSVRRESGPGTAA